MQGLCIATRALWQGRHCCMPNSDRLSWGLFLTTNPSVLLPLCCLQVCGLFPAHCSRLAAGPRPPLLLPRPGGSVVCPPKRLVRPCASSANRRLHSSSPAACTPPGAGCLGRGGSQQAADGSSREGHLRCAGCIQAAVAEAAAGDSSSCSSSACHGLGVTWARWAVWLCLSENERSNALILISVETGMHAAMAGTLGLRSKCG